MQLIQLPRSQLTNDAAFHCRSNSSFLLPGSIAKGYPRKFGPTHPSYIMDEHPPQSTETTPEEEVPGAPEADSKMLRTLLSHLDGVVFRCRGDAESTMEFVSEGCSRLTGLPARSLLHNRKARFADLVHADDREARRSAMAQALPSRERYTIEYRLMRSDGAIRWVSER